LQGYTWRVTASAGKQHQLPSGDWADVQRGAGEDAMRNTPMILSFFRHLFLPRYDWDVLIGFYQDRPWTVHDRRLENQNGSFGAIYI